MSRHHHPAQTRDHQNQKSRATNEIRIVWQWKDELDASAPWWRRLYFWAIYRPFNQFSRFVVRVPSYTGEDKDGKLWWLDFQDAVPEEWQAIQATDGRRNWGFATLKVNEPLPLETSVDELIEIRYPNTDSKTSKRYQENGNGTVEFAQVDVLRLVSKVESTNGLVENYKMNSL